MVMDQYLHEMWTGPGHFRFFVQPLVAMLLGVRDGRADAKNHLPPYLLGFFHSDATRVEVARKVAKRLRVPLALGICLSLVFQVVIRGHILLGPAIGFGVVFVTLPYCLARALANPHGWIHHGPRVEA